MRKPKKEKLSYKVANQLDDFYKDYITNERIKACASRLKNSKQDKKEVMGLSKVLRDAIDKYYIENYVERKYVFFSNLYELYNMLCEYFFKDSKFVENGDKIIFIKDIELFGYETAFSENISKKIDEILKRFFTIISESTLRYLSTVKKENKKKLENEIDNIMSETIYIKSDDKKISKEILYVNSILNRINFARKNIEFVSLDSKKKDNNDDRIKKNIKSTLTRLENTLKIILEEM